MKTPVWEATAGATIALLATKTFVFADLYTFTLVIGGSVLRYTTADVDMGYGGTTWTHGGPLFEQAGGSNRPTAHWKVGLDVDTWQIGIVPRPVEPTTGAAYPDCIGTVQWLAAAVAGYLDGAVVTVDRAYLPAWPAYPFTPPVTPTGVVRLFAGRVAEVDIGRTAVAVSINSHLELLNQQMPRRLYQAGCINTLFDAGCSLSAAAFAVSGTIAAATAAGAGTIASAASPPGGSSGSFAFGYLTVTSGRNAGFSRGIRAWTAGSPGSFALMSPFPFAFAGGETATFYPGCDKQLSTCGLYGNSLNFGGCPYIPAPETAV